MTITPTPADQVAALALLVEDQHKLFARFAEITGEPSLRGIAEVSGHLFAAHAHALRESAAAGNALPLMELADIATDWHLKRSALLHGLALRDRRARK